MRDQRTELRAQPPADHAPAWEGWTVNDVLLRHGLLALDRRYLFALPNITVGRVTREIVHELQQIAVEYDGLLTTGASSSPRFSEQAVRVKIGDVLGSAAWACEALQEPEQARAYFVAAAVAFTRAGATAKARRCRMELERLNFYGAGDAPTT
jgi:hypothetical protein